MGMRRAADLPRCRVELEGERRLGDEVRDVRADEVDTQGVARLGVADDLDEALVLAADDRLRHGLERNLADLVGQPLFLALLLGEAHRRDLGPRVRRPRSRRWASPS